MKENTETNPKALPVKDTVKENNGEVKYAIENAIFTLLGQTVLFSLYKHLKDNYSISPDEIPDHLETFVKTLERTFGMRSARTIERAIAKRFYFRHGLEFVEVDGYRLQDYIEDAKRQLNHSAITPSGYRNVESGGPANSCCNYVWLRSWLLKQYAHRAHKGLLRIRI
jgi:hypothetical protein